jgi:hypothetical protein
MKTKKHIELLNYVLNNPFIYSYLEAAIWSSQDWRNVSAENPTPETMDNYAIINCSYELLRDAINDCSYFLNKHGVKTLLEQDGQSIEQQGHDFWFTRNHHGAGYWDGNYPIAGEELTRISHTIKEYSLYIGDDNLIYGTYS